MILSNPINLDCDDHCTTINVINSLSKKEKKITIKTKHSSTQNPIVYLTQIKSQNPHSPLSLNGPWFFFILLLSLSLLLCSGHPGLLLHAH